MFLPVAFPPFILVFDYLLQVTAGYGGCVLAKHHRESAMLANTLFENDVDRRSIIWSTSKDLASFSRKHVCMQRHDAAASDEWEPC